MKIFEGTAMTHQKSKIGVLLEHGTILAIEFLSISFVERQRSMEKDPKKYPGGAFDPLRYSKDPKKFEEYKDGKLCWLRGVYVQQLAIQEPDHLENLATHLADSWHNSIGHVIIPYGKLKASMQSAKSDGV